MRYAPPATVDVPATVWPVGAWPPPIPGAHTLPGAAQSVDVGVPFTQATAVFPLQVIAAPPQPPPVSADASIGAPVSLASGANVASDAPSPILASTVASTV